MNACTWKSMDGGSTWSYIGQPDGAQAAGSGLGFVGVGAGGGDEDIIALPNGNIVMTSLWLGGNTTCTSSNGGAVWACDPQGSTLPADDRQWLASLDSNVVYITSKQLGTLLNGTESIYVAKSTDGGVTFPFVTEVTTPELGVQPGDQGNMWWTTTMATSTPCSSILLQPSCSWPSPWTRGRPGC